jgi:hypothetical protein
MKYADKHSLLILLYFINFMDKKISVPCDYALCHEGVEGKWKSRPTHVYPNFGTQSTSCSGHSKPGTHCKEGQVGPRTGLDTAVTLLQEELDFSCHFTDSGAQVLRCPTGLLFPGTARFPLRT